MAVEAVVSVVIQKVTDLLIQDAIIFEKVIDLVEDIRIQLRAMRGFLTDAEERQKKDDKEAAEWVREYLETVYQVEDIVESYVLRLARKKRKMGFLQNYGFFFHDRKACHNLRRKMKDIEERIKNLKMQKPKQVEDASLRCSSMGPEENHVELVQHDMRSNRSSFKEVEAKTRRNSSSLREDQDLNFVGFTEYVDELKNRLTQETGKIIPVVGPFGSGKTTLVRRVYNRKSIKAQFECRAWAEFSEEHTKDALLRIWNQVNKKQKDKELSVLDEDELEKRLSEFLQGKEYLIIFDEARNSSKAESWKKLMKAFPGTETGSKCKVVLITCNNTISTCLNLGGYSQPICVKPLEADKSWELFLRKSGLERETSLKHDILKKCKGLPRDIVLLGGFVSTNKFSSGNWKRLLNQPSEIWQLSYTDLPAHYKLCLLYLGLFPKEFDVSVRRILRLWLAEGFLLRSTGPSEDLADECFNYLAKRNLINITKFRSDGGAKACRLPGFLRQHLSPMAQEINLFHIHHQTENPPESQEGVRRIVGYADIGGYAPGSDSESIHVKNLRSYLSFNSPRHDVPAKEVGVFLSKIIGNKGFGLLRVLDLEGVYKPTLPATLKHLFQLRYLGLRWTFLDVLPESVGDLPYLETLDLKRTYISNLPSSVWKLKHLRHLNLPQVQLDTRMLQPGSQLLTLWGLIIDDDSNMENGLGRLADLRELGITCQLEEVDKVMSWITSLSHLQTLRLTSKDDMGRPANISLQPLSELVNLFHLKVLGNLSQLPEKKEFPPRLKVLTLSVSYLKEDPMPTLSRLPNLSVLRLLAKSYMGEKMDCPKNGFSNLHTLKLWMLEELKEWTVQKGGMPCITKINIRHCHKLKRLPLELLRRTTLEELVLDNMTQEFEQNTRENISSDTALKVRSYEFSALPWEKDAKLWSKHPEREDTLALSC